MNGPKKAVSTLSVFLLALIFGPLLFTQNSLAQAESQFGLIHWEADFLGNSQPGSACWVAGSGGDLRLEVLLGNPSFSTPEDLLAQEGSGFTLILSEGLDGTFNPWLSPWQKLDPGAGTWVQLATRIVSGQNPFQDSGSWLLLAGAGPLKGVRPRFLQKDAFPSLERAIRVQLPELKQVADGQAVQPPKSFRGQNVARASGHGGQDEILTLKHFSEAEKGYSWRLTSSRKPGQIQLSNPILSVLPEPGVEVFAPLWPLAQLIDLNLFEIDQKNRELLHLRQVE